MLNYFEPDEKECTFDYVAIMTAEITEDFNKLILRKYSNGVEIYYTLNEDNVHLVYIIANEKGKGNGSLALKEFLYDFNSYNIVTEAIFFLLNWYEKFGFIYVETIEDMFCERMIKYKRG